MKITEAKKKDINSIVKLGREMADFHRKFDGYYKPGEEMEDFLRKISSKSLGKRNIKILIVKNKNKILGYGIAHIEKPKVYVKPKKIGYIAGLYIKMPYRRKGIGKEIFDKFLGWFKSRNIKNIELSVDSRNKIGRGAWKKYGFFEYQKRMRIDL